MGDVTEVRVAYDELGLFHENAAEFGLPYGGPPPVERVFVDVGDRRRLSALRWGTAEPQLVLLHGGSQNAHTWDTVAMALGRPLVAIDLPGHGHSDGNRAEARSMLDSAGDVARAIELLAPGARGVVGMSAGGMTTLVVGTEHPALVRRMVLVDILPNPVPEMAKRILDFVDGPETFPSFQELLDRTIGFNPTRSVSSLRRGILHNAVQLDDGSWRWRHRRDPLPRAPRLTDQEAGAHGSQLWERVSSVAVPFMLVRGMADGSVIDDAMEDELLRRLPDARVERVEEAGHSVQGDRPIELAGLLDDFLF